MSAPHEVLSQLLSAAQADTLDSAGASVWASAAQTLQSLLSAAPSLQDVDGRLVMPDEISGAFSEPHLVVPLELSTSTEQTATAYLVIGTAAAAQFLDSQADDPSDEEQQTLVVAATILGQVVQSVNAAVFEASPLGLVIALDDLVVNAMPELLGAMDEPAMLLTAALQGERQLPFSVVLPGAFLDLVAAGMPAHTVTDATTVPVAAPVTGAAAASLLDSLPTTLTDAELEAGSPLREERRTGPRPFSGVPPQVEPGQTFSAEPPREPTPIAQGPATHRARFAPFPDAPPPAGRSPIDLLAGLQMNVAVELGRTELTVSEVLGLGPGSVIELDRLAGEPVDILVNDRLIARGEVVVVDESFGIRVVEVVRRVVEQEERVG